jgi:hypothetical protein
MAIDGLGRAGDMPPAAVECDPSRPAKVKRVGAASCSQPETGSPGRSVADADDNAAESCPLFMTEPPRRGATSHALDAIAALIDEPTGPGNAGGVGMGEIQVHMALSSCGRAPMRRAEDSSTRRDEERDATRCSRSRSRSPRRKGS